MIRAIRPNAMAQDDAAMASGWNVAPNLAYVLHLLPGPASCGALLYGEDGSTLIATGAALVGTAQPCVLIPQSGQTVEMVDADLGWHLLLTTTGTESHRTIRIGPAVDLPDEIHPVYGDDDIALARATAAIDAAAHYVDDVTVTCPLGLGAGLGDVVSVPVDGGAVVGQVESITWTATPDGTTETAVIRRHVAIAPEAFAEIAPPMVADDSGTATHLVGTSGNVLANDEAGLTVTAVNGLTANVGTAVDGDNGGSFTIASDGSWTFSPDGDFALLSGSETADTSVTYHASDGTAEAMATLTVTVSSGAAPELWTPAEIATAIWLDAADSSTITLIGSAVSNWADKSGMGRGVAQAAEGSRPVYDSASKSVNFDGVDDHLFNSLPFMYAAGCSYVYCVAKPVDLISNAYFLSEGRSSNNNPLYSNMRMHDGTASSGGGFLRNDVGTIRLAQTVGQFANFWVTGQADILSSEDTGTSFGMRKNGGVATSGSYSRAGSVTLDRFCVGGILRGSFAAPISIDLHELLVLTSAPTADLRQKIEGYLANKWGLAAKLPSDHPYKSAPPTI